MSDSTVDGNDSSNGAGGIYNDLGTLNVTGSTISHNTATFIGGGISNHHTLHISNSTLSGNKALMGGAIYTDEGYAVTLTSNTISGNSASDVMLYGGHNWYTMT